MVSINYINQDVSDNPFINESLLFESVLNDKFDEIDRLFGAYYAEYYSLQTEAEILDDDSNLKIFVKESEEGENNVFSKIGDKVKGLIAETIKFIKEVISRLKSMLFQSKTDTAKLDRLIKEHPELKDKILSAFESGALEMRDVKSFAELDKEFNEIMKLSQKADVDQNSLKARWNRALEKFHDADKTTVVNVARAITTVAGVVMLASQLTQAQQKAMESSGKIQNMMAESAARFSADPDLRSKVGKVGYREAQYIFIKGYTKGAHAAVSDFQSTGIKCGRMLRRMLDIAEDVTHLSPGRSNARAGELIKDLADLHKANSKP